MPPSPILQGRVAVVTGAAGGIGRATAFLLARCGAHVFAGDIAFSSENNDMFAELGIIPSICDVRREDHVETLIQRAASQNGRLDILVNNAGVALVKQITDVTENEWDTCLDTNLKGAFFASKYAIRRMQSGGSGAIVNIASNAGLLPRAQDPVYSVSKAALVALTKSLALAHAKDRVRVNVVCPGPVEATRMKDIGANKLSVDNELLDNRIAACPLALANGRLISREEVAEAVVYLVSDASIMVTGTAIAIDGGKSLGVPMQ